MKNKTNVLIAGIGGASLGTEILKSLLLAGDYNTYGCDISEYAFGHYQEGFKKTYLIKLEEYIDSILQICSSENISFVIPGGEQPMVLLGKANERLKSLGVCLVSNSAEIINNFSDKGKTFEILSRMGVKTPRTIKINNLEEINDFCFPAIIKPVLGTGGSSFVFLAGDIEEAKLYALCLLRNRREVIIQEYIYEDEGEYTVGVLSLPGQQVVGSIALKRVFNSKLSISYKGEHGLISSGYSQGLIDDFKNIRMVAEKIAKIVGSEGPLNIQGRVKEGQFLPFEINPRFSASTYLRALAGFNEVDILLKYLANGELLINNDIRYGYYLRSLSEIFIRKDGIIK